MTENLFYRWLPIVQAWVIQLNRFGMTPQGPTRLRGAITTPSHEGTAAMPSCNPLKAMAAYRVGGRVPRSNAEAAQILDLPDEFIGRLIPAIYDDNPDLETRYRLLQALLPEPSTP